MKNKNQICEISSGNVFADLGFENPKEELAKSDLAYQIYNIIKQKKLTKQKSSKLLDIKQAKLSDIIKGETSEFSIEKLNNFLKILRAI